MPKVSIIIPFNNVEKYINECLDSVLNQTLQDIEIICINDASEDGTLAIVEEYQQKDSRIKLINLPERKGQGYARNRGIEIALGEYIGFVDSDDFIKPNMYEVLYKKAQENDCDITMCQAVEYDDMTGRYIQSDYYALAPLGSFADNVFSAEDSKHVILDINVALWNKIYKRSYLIGIGEKFPEGFIYEDLPFFFGSYLPAKRISIVWQEFYMYRINRVNSTMQQFNNKILDRPYMVSLTYEKMKDTPYLSDMKHLLQAWIINDLFHRYTLLKEHYQKEFFFLMKKVFQNLEIENIDDLFWKKVYHFEGYLLVMNNSFEDFNQKVFNEYLDIHKVEDRILSQILNREELDYKISQIYLDIEKNYKYTEKLVEDKFGEIAQQSINVIREERKETQINDNCVVTKEQFSSLYESVKDLSYVVHDNNSDMLRKNFELKDKLEGKINFEKKEIIEQIRQIQKNLSANIISNSKEQQKFIEASFIDLTNKFETLLENSKKETDEKIKEKELEFSKLLEEQNKNHSEEIALLKAQMLDMEQRLSEKLETPCRKIHGYFANRKK